MQFNQVTTLILLLSIITMCPSCNRLNADSNLEEILKKAGVKEWRTYQYDCVNGKPDKSTRYLRTIYRVDKDGIVKDQVTFKREGQNLSMPIRDTDYELNDTTYIRVHVELSANSSSLSLLLDTVQNGLTRSSTFYGSTQLSTDMIEVIPNENVRQLFEILGLSEQDRIEYSQYEYDPDDNLIYEKIRKYGPELDDTTVMDIIYRYEYLKGHLVRKVFVNPSNSEEQAVQTLKYDDRDSLVQSISYDINGFQRSTTTIEYDFNEFAKVTQFLTGPDGRNPGWMKYTYYSREGNRIDSLVLYNDQNQRISTTVTTSTPGGVKISLKNDVSLMYGKHSTFTQFGFNKDRTYSNAKTFDQDHDLQQVDVYVYTYY